MNKMRLAAGEVDDTRLGWFQLGEPVTAGAATAKGTQSGRVSLSQQRAWLSAFQIWEAI